MPRIHVELDSTLWYLTIDDEVLVFTTLKSMVEQIKFIFDWKGAQRFHGVRS